MSQKLGLAVVLAACALRVWGTLSSPSDLLVNGQKKPVAIEADAAGFSWAVETSNRDERQSAYQILIVSSPTRLAANEADVWDSGKTVSEISASVCCAREGLSPGQRYWWKVRVWDQTGTPTAFSEPAFFDTGISPGEWRAKYLWDGTSNVNNFAYFRKGFFLGAKPEYAKVYVSAHNDYVLYLNERLLGRGPARSNPCRYGQYNAYDVTDIVQSGSNVLAAIGHWQGNWRDSGVNARPGFILEARCDFRKGPSTWISTDDTWRVLATTGFVETNATFFGAAGGVSNRAAIQFNATLEPRGWRSVQFDDAPWPHATVVSRPDFRLFAQSSGLQQEISELKPIAVTRSTDSWLVDFGRCIDGWPKLTFRANKRGDKVRINYFQMSGRRYPSGWDEYTCGGGVETWKADVGRHCSFQVLEIRGYAGILRPKDVQGIWAYTASDVAGQFKCSSPLLNKIYKMCERSARQNVQQGIISVDANREQSPWTADSWNIGNVLLYNHRDTRVVEKVVRDYAGEQLACGDFHACSPASMFRIPEWSMYWPMLLWQEYLFSGNDQMLREMAPRLVRFLSWIRQYQDPETRLLNPPDGDWNNGIRISEYAGGEMPSGGYNIATACQYYENLRIAARVMAALHEETPGPAEYLAQAEEVKAAINTRLFNGEYYLARVDRKEMFPLAAAWALRFDIVPVATKGRICAALRKCERPSIGGYGGDAFYSGLLNAGDMGDYVVRDLSRYSAMVSGNGANWESFSADWGEVNHAWTAYPGYLFQKHFSGIQPTGPGFSTFDVRPEIQGLENAESSVPTIKGLITTRWEKTGTNRLKLMICVPGNSRATVYIPKLRGEIRVSESGRAVWPPNSAAKIPGIDAVLNEESAIKCVLGSGRYRFEAELIEHSRPTRPH